MVIKPVAGLFISRIPQSTKYDITDIWILSDGLDEAILRVLVAQMPQKKLWVHINGPLHMPADLQNRSSIEVNHYVPSSEINFEQFNIYSLINRGILISYCFSIQIV